jgi:hypothetical protein
VPGPADPGPSSEARARLADRQAALLAALVGGAPAPAGLDADRVAVQAEALVAKRRRVARRAWPELAAALGDRFEPDFDAWARQAPKRTGETLPDAVRFGRHLRRQGLLPRGLGLDLARRMLRARRFR